MISSYMTSLMSDDAGRRFFAEETVSVMAGVLVKYTIAIASVIMSLGLVGLDAIALNIILAIMLIGVVSVIILAIKDILPDFTAGLYLKKSLKVGEFIKLNSHRGMVEKVDAISVTLKDGQKRIMIPNSLLVKTPVEKRGRKR